MNQVQKSEVPPEKKTSDKFNFQLLLVCSQLEKY